MAGSIKVIAGGGIFDLVPGRVVIRFSANPSLLNKSANSLWKGPFQSIVVLLCLNQSLRFLIERKCLNSVAVSLLHSQPE